jgi:hypothetical protein
MVDMRYLRWWADLLDSRFEIPGTRIRFGIDPILSLVPGVGDLASPAFAIVLLVQGLDRRVPRVVLVRMALNALIDALIGMVPVAGNVGDIFWRANLMNLELLERHAQPGRPATQGDHAFVWTVVLLFALAVLVPVTLAAWLAYVVLRWVFGR